MQQRLMIAISSLVLASCGKPEPSLDAPRPDYGRLNRMKSSIQAASALELFSLDPYPKFIADPPAPTPSGPTFQGQVVLGQVVISDARERQMVVDAIAADLAPRSAPVLCFWPHHGARITVGSETIDILICYDCVTAQVSPGEEFRTATRGKATLDGVLDAHRVPRDHDARDLSKPATPPSPQSGRERPNGGAA